VPPPRTVAVVVFEDVQSLDAVGPFEVFHTATRLLAADGRGPAYAPVVVSVDGRAVRAQSGLGLGVDTTLDAVVDGGVDTLVVAGGTGVREAIADSVFLAAVGRAAARARRVAAVCSGAFVLAELGLLDGRRATTHWGSTDLLASRYPDVEVDPDPIFVRDGDVWTSAGVTAGMDLALALVADDLGPEVAHETAAWLVLFAQRPGGQSQFSATMRTRPPRRRDLSELLGWIADHPDAELTVDALARRAGMSPRHLARVFVDECGVTPAEHVLAVRLERARRLLETSDLTVEAVAERVGVSGAALHRMFKRGLATTPHTYRSHFARR
jgi:transcriptional regulator GlxA family with amidase domain